MKTNSSVPNLAVSTACASGTHAIGEAAMHIKRGEGGYDARWWCRSGDLPTF
ncbi:MAG: beta-ketoacyl synthase N-terminal-like domain-containing protein [Nitrosomonas sp.]